MNAKTTWLKDSNGNKLSAAQKGKRAVRIAASFFRTNGFLVSGDQKSINANGTDLIISKGKRTRKVEVKCVFRAKGSWKVSRTVRREDELVAIIFPNGRVHIETIDSFSALCPPKGARAVTELVWAYETNEEAMADIKRMAELEAKA